MGMNYKFSTCFTTYQKTYIKSTVVIAATLTIYIIEI